jgi:hypothetical protein
MPRFRAMKRVVLVEESGGSSNSVNQWFRQIDMNEVNEDSGCEHHRHPIPLGSSKYSEDAVKQKNEVAGLFSRRVKNRTATVNERRPDASQYRRFHTSNGSRAYFDAARITLTTPRWRGTAINASYWFSKSLDLGTDYAVTGGGQERWRSAQTEWDYIKDQKGLSSFDQPHAFLVQGAWSTGRATGGHWLGRLYRNWDLTSVLLLKSGTPFTVDAGSDAPGFGNADGSGGDRPMVIDPSVLGRTIGDPDTSVQLLPRSAFRFIRAPIEMEGNLGRNTFRKGSIANLNASLGRTWTLPRDWNMTIRRRRSIYPTLLNLPNPVSP